MDRSGRGHRALERRVVERVGPASVDALLYLGGTWEEGAFTDAYSFAKCDPDEIERVLVVNTVAPIRLVHALLPALRRSASPRCVALGALSGLDHSASREVANSASKYGLRGAWQALAHELPDIAFSVVNPGNVATAEVVADIDEGRFGPQRPIPMSDLIAVVELVLSVSHDTVISEIDLAQRFGSRREARDAP